MRFLYFQETEIVTQERGIANCGPGALPTPSLRSIACRSRRCRSIVNVASTCGHSTETFNRVNVHHPRKDRQAGIGTPLRRYLSCKSKVPDACSSLSPNVQLWSTRNQIAAAIIKPVCKMKLMYALQPAGLDFHVKPFNLQQLRVFPRRPV